jgi:ATP dependent DNA ligase domain
VFDVLILGGKNVMSEQFSTRRDLLSRHVLPKLGEPIRESEQLNASLPDLMRAVKAHGFEGIVAKRLDSRYEPGQRSGAWLKMRINQGQEFVIGGYTPSPRSFDALIFGYSSAAFAVHWPPRRQRRRGGTSRMIGSIGLKRAAPGRPSRSRKSAIPTCLALNAWRAFGTVHNSPS